MKVKVKVPATSANLGPGFDVAGLAVTLYNTFTFELIDEGLQITGCPEQFCNADNMTYQAFVEGAKACGLDFNGVRIECSGDVPYTRGLGSSSTCIVAGIVGAYAFVDRYDERQEILELATQIEGHPDNVAPAIFGGLTVSVMSDGVTTLNIPVKHDYRFVALIPPFTLSTEKSRSVLPQELPRADAIANVSHLALMVASLINGYDEGLKLGFKDRLHQPYRGPLIQGFAEIMNILEKDERILGAYLSGAGPTIMVVIDADDTDETGIYFGRPLTQQQLTKYVDNCIKAIHSGLYSYVAHPDLACYKTDDPFYYQEMKRLCLAAKEANMPLEFNLLGYSTNRHYPNTTFFKIAKEVGNKVIIGTDAHESSALLDMQTYQQAKALLEQMGLELTEEIKFLR